MQITGESLFLFLFWTMFIGVLWMPLTWLLLSIFTPKKLLERYFKEPHFTLSETVLMAQFPGFLIRTAIFGWAILTPKLGKKRKIVNVKAFMPTWYYVLLSAYMISTLLTLFIIVTLMPILFIM